MVSRIARFVRVAEARAPTHINSSVDDQGRDVYMVDAADGKGRDSS